MDHFVNMLSVILIQSFSFINRVHTLIRIIGSSTISDACWAQSVRTFSLILFERLLGTSRFSPLPMIIVVYTLTSHLHVAWSRNAGCTWITIHRCLLLRGPVWFMSGEIWGKTQGKVGEKKSCIFFSNFSIIVKVIPIVTLEWIIFHVYRFSIFAEKYFSNFWL